MWIYHPELDRKVEVADSALMQLRLSGWDECDPPPPPVVKTSPPSLVVEDDVEKSPRRARKPGKES